MPLFHIEAWPPSTWAGSSGFAERSADWGIYSHSPKENTKLLRNKHTSEAWSLNAQYWRLLRSLLHFQLFHLMAGNDGIQRLVSHLQEIFSLSIEQTYTEQINSSPQTIQTLFSLRTNFQCPLLVTLGCHSHCSLRNNQQIQACGVMVSGFHAQTYRPGLLFFHTTRTKGAS